jgi:hypothetical protein
VVPLGRPFQVPEPVWRWGLGLALTDSDTTAVIAVLVSLLIEGFAVWVVVKLVRLTRNWRRHRQQPRRAESESATRIGDTGKTAYTQSQTLSSQARTTTGI